MCKTRIARRHRAEGAFYDYCGDGKDDVFLDPEIESLRVSVFTAHDLTISTKFGVFYNGVLSILSPSDVTERWYDHSTIRIQGSRENDRNLDVYMEVSSSNIDVIARNHMIHITIRRHAESTIFWIIFPDNTSRQRYINAQNESFFVHRR